MPAKFKIVTEKMSKDETDNVTKYANLVAELSKVARETKPVALLKPWFGSLDNKALERVVLIDKYLNEKCTQITFVKKEGGATVDDAKVMLNDYGQVIPQVEEHKDPKDLSHVQSGLRIFILPYFWAVPKEKAHYERVNTVYHEISHKVLGTTDSCYGAEACKALATWTAGSPPSALKKYVEKRGTSIGDQIYCADSYGYFMADLDAFKNKK